MGLTDIASSMDETIETAGAYAERQQAQIVESDANKMAHHIVAYVLEAADVGHDPYDLGATMVQGACIGEDEAGGFLAEPVIKFLEAVLDGAKSILSERQGEEPIFWDPVAHCVQYHLAHNRWPASAPPGVIAKAKAAMASGRSGKGKGASFGLYL